DPAFRELLAKKKSPPAATGTPAPDAAPEPAPLSSLPREVVSAAGGVGESVLPPTALAQIEELGDPLLKIDEDGVIRYANAEAIQVFAPGKRLVDTAFRHHFALDDSERYEDHFHRPLAD